MTLDIMGIYRIQDAKTGYRVRVQDADGREWELTPQEYAERGYRPDPSILVMMGLGRLEDV